MRAITTKFIKLLLVLGLSSFMLACQQTEHTDAANTSKETQAMSKHVTIKVGESGEDFAKRYPELLDINRQPAGVDFYRINLDNNPRGTVTVEHGKHSIFIPGTIAVTGYIDRSFLSDGLAEFDIYAELSEPEFITHDEARLKTYAILQEVLKAGWRPLTDESEPRITGQDRLDYVLNTFKYIGLDPSFLPSFKEWMQLEDSTKWYFYADHLYLDVSFKRAPEYLDPEKPGAYLLNFNLKSEAEYYKAYVAPRNRAKWKELFPASYAKLAPQRAKKEAALIAKGIKIDTDYQNPPLPDLK